MGDTRPILGYACARTQQVVWTQLDKFTPCGQCVPIRSLPTGTAGVNEASANLNALTQKIALEAYEHWDADRDSKVGKLLCAIGGVTGIRPDLDNARAALSTALAASTRTTGDTHPTTPTPDEGASDAV